MDLITLHGNHMKLKSYCENVYSAWRSWSLTGRLYVLTSSGREDSVNKCGHPDHENGRKSKTKILLHSRLRQGTSCHLFLCNERTTAIARVLQWRRLPYDSKKWSFCTTAGRSQNWPMRNIRPSFVVALSHSCHSQSQQYTKIWKTDGRVMALIVTLHILAHFRLATVHSCQGSRWLYGRHKRMHKCWLPWWKVGRIAYTERINRDNWHNTWRT